jgi:hypothetical protein
MAKTNDSEVCQQYLHEYIEMVKTELNQFQTRLNEQKSSCPIRDSTVDQIDQSLNKFIDCQRNYLSTRNIKELTQFKEQIAEKESLEEISVLSLRTDQVNLRELFPTLIIWKLMQFIHCYLA